MPESQPPPRGQPPAAAQGPWTTTSEGLAARRPPAPAAPRLTTGLAHPSRPGGWGGGGERRGHARGPLRCSTHRGGLSITDPLPGARGASRGRQTDPNVAGAAASTASRSGPTDTQGPSAAGSHPSGVASLAVRAERAGAFEPEAGLPAPPAGDQIGRPAQPATGLHRYRRRRVSPLTPSTAPMRSQDQPSARARSTSARSWASS